MPAVDNLKVALIATVVVIHAVMGYAAFFDGWPYAEVQEVHLPDAAVIVVFALFAPIGLFMMALLFFVAGLLSTPSLDRKGPARFARDRLLRLGVPFAVFVLVLWPGAQYALFRSLGRTRLGYWAFFTGRLPDNGPLWFVGLLLLLSLAYAALRGARPARPVRDRPLTVPVLVDVAVAIGVTSFVVRLIDPYAGATAFDLNEWQWPECIALFVVGTAAAREGWLTAVPDAIRHTAAQTTAIAGGVLAGFLLVALGLGVRQDDFLGGPHWASLGVACCEGVLTVFGSIWLLSVAQRWFGHSSRLRQALARSAYAAFVVQGPVLIGLAFALRAVPAVAEVKAVAVALGGLVVSFGLGWLIVSRTRPRARLR
jgi:hypothetical protein